MRQYMYVTANKKSEAAQYSRVFLKSSIQFKEIIVENLLLDLWIAFLENSGSFVPYTKLLDAGLKLKPARVEKFAVH